MTNPPPDALDIARRHSRYRVLEGLERIDRTQHELLNSVPRPFAPRSAEADPMRLRGIPAIGRGVTGAIPGTAPHMLFGE